MEPRVTPALFNGSALAALWGLVFGLVLHDPWINHAGGPQISLSSAAAAEVIQPAADEPQPIEAQQAELDIGPVPPDPLPVTRLDPGRFDLHPATVQDEAGDQVADAVPPEPGTDLD